MDRWELARDLVRRHIESDYNTDGGNWRTQSNLKVYKVVETEQQKVARIRAKMTIYAAQTLTLYERRMKIEYDARQIMT